RLRDPVDAAFELTTPVADQVLTDVGASRVGGDLRDAACQLHALERDTKLAVAGWIGQFLHRVPIAVAASKVHARVDAGGIALEHMLHEAHALEKLAPVER